MGKATGFLEYQRRENRKRPVGERIADYREVESPLPEEEMRYQGARCMNCGVAFCHSAVGCPLGNLIPEWNHEVYEGRWSEAAPLLHATNNFPEFTGRVCPAPCETACVLGINEPAVSIKQIEVAIVERAFAQDEVRPEPAKRKTGKKAAVVGSGPAGLAAAQQLARAGHEVTVYEKDDRIGGLLTYGIPDFKLEKEIVFRRVQLMEREGVQFKTSVHVGVDLSIEELRSGADAVVLAGGAQQPRDLAIPGRELGGVHFAMDFLSQQNRRVAGLPINPAREILAKGKRVVVIGGGDTGSDCVGTSVRQGCESLVQLELLPKPPDARAGGAAPWPNYPMLYRTSSSHEEADRRFGPFRDYAVSSQRFEGTGAKLERIKAIRVAWSRDKDGRMGFKEIAGSEFDIEADLVLLAMGFLGPIKTGLIEQLGVALDERGNIKTDENHQTSIEGVFAAGDMRRGQSLVVWAIAEGRAAARGVDAWLMGSTRLP